MDWLIIDAHNDTMMKMFDAKTFEIIADISLPTSFAIDLPKMEAGNVSVAVFAAYSDDYGDLSVNMATLNASIMALRETARRNPERFKLVSRADEVEQGLLSGHRMGIQSIEGAYAFNESNLETLMTQYADVGVKLIAPVWNHSNPLGEGTLEAFASGEKSPKGLTALGQRFIQLMDRHQMMVDVSHMSEAMFWDVVAASKRPLIASHSGASAIMSHVRNLTDEQLKAIAQSDGVACVVFCRYFIGDEHADVEVLVDHIHHMINVAGEDHVGLGSDFDGATMPVGLNDISMMGRISEALIKRGLSENAIRKVMGENLLRLIRSFSSKGDTTFPLKNKPLLEEGVVSVLLTSDEQLRLKGGKPCCLVDGQPILPDFDPSTNRLFIDCSNLVQGVPRIVTLAFLDEMGKRFFATEVYSFK